MEHGVQPVNFEKDEKFILPPEQCENLCAGKNTERYVGVVHIACADK